MLSFVQFDISNFGGTLFVSAIIVSALSLGLWGATFLFNFNVKPFAIVLTVVVLFLVLVVSNRSNIWTDVRSNCLCELLQSINSNQKFSCRPLGPVHRLRHADNFGRRKSEIVRRRVHTGGDHTLCRSDHLVQDHSLAARR